MEDIDADERPDVAVDDSLLGVTPRKSAADTESDDSVPATRF